MLGYSSPRNGFVGRAKERSLFARWLDDPDAPLSIATLTGIGGVGKSTLLSEFMRMGAERGTAGIWLDGRACVSTPSSFIEYVSSSLSLDTPPGSRSYPLQPLFEASPSRRMLLCIDNFEELRLLEGWFAEAFLPKLPRSGIFVALASRPDFSAIWHTNALTDMTAFAIRLSNFTMEETLSFVRARVEAPAAAGSLHRMTEGHPLALALTLEMAAKQGLLKGDESSIVSQRVSAGLLRELTRPDLLSLIDILTVLETANQELLSLIAGAPVPLGDYQALRELSFVRVTPEGVSLHDVARVHLLRDFKLREPQRYQRLRGDILTLLLGNLRTADKASSRRIAAQILLLCKDALPALDRSYADITTDFYAPGIDYYRPDDLPVLHDLIAQWCVYSVEPEQEEMYHRFLDDLAVQSPESMILQRDAEGIPVGLFINVLLHRDNARMLEPYFADELGECFTRPELNVEPDRADTYFPILAAATDRRADCTREELVGHLALRGLSMLGEGMRAVLIVTNEHLKHFLTNLGFHMRRARTRQFDFSQGEAHVLTVDLRAGQFADWVLSFIAKADGPRSETLAPAAPTGRAHPTEAQVRKMLANLQSPARLDDYVRFATGVRTGMELKAKLQWILNDAGSGLGPDDRAVLAAAYVAHPHNTVAAAERCCMSRSTYFRHLREAVSQFRHILIHLP